MRTCSLSGVVSAAGGQDIPDSGPMYLIYNGDIKRYGTGNFSIVNYSWNGELMTLKDGVFWCLYISCRDLFFLFIT